MIVALILVGFVVAAFVVGLLAEHDLDRNWKTAIVPFRVGTVSHLSLRRLVARCFRRAGQGAGQGSVSVSDRRCDQTRPRRCRDAVGMGDCKRI